MRIKYKFWSSSRAGEIINGPHSIIWFVIKNDLLYRKYQAPKQNRGEVITQYNGRSYFLAYDSNAFGSQFDHGRSSWYKENICLHFCTFLLASLDQRCKTILSVLRYMPAELLQFRYRICAINRHTFNGTLKVCLLMAQIAIVAMLGRTFL